MKYLTIISKATLFVLMLITTNIQANEAVKVDVTTIYLVRHTEKELNGEKDPRLTERGMERAKFLARILSTVDVDVVYSTDTTRTRDTAKPTATSKGKEVIIYDARGIDYAEFLQNNLNKTVLVVGHSNTIPNFVNALIGENRFQDLDESNYSSLFIVDIVGEQRIGKLLTVNPF